MWGRGGDRSQHSDGRSQEGVAPRVLGSQCSPRSTSKGNPHADAGERNRGGGGDTEHHQHIFENSRDETKLNVTGSSSTEQGIRPPARPGQTQPHHNHTTQSCHPAALPAGRPSLRCAHGYVTKHKTNTKVSCLQTRIRGHVESCPHTWVCRYTSLSADPGSRRHRGRAHEPSMPTCKV